MITSQATTATARSYYGLTFWTPNINIFRDPRWGRGQETYGEDPFLTARLGVAFIRGLARRRPELHQGDGLRETFCRPQRAGIRRATRFDADPPERDFYETYLPQFEAAVREGHVGAVMGAYNAVYGMPACANPLLLTNILRGDGVSTAMSFPIAARFTTFMPIINFADTPEAAAAAAVQGG